MQGVELSMVNTHQQIQHVEDEVIKELKAKWSNISLDLQSTCEVLKNKFDDCCDQIQHSCIMVMDSFIILEKGITLGTRSPVLSQYMHSTW
jgi:hypothetical protein